MIARYCKAPTEHSVAVAPADPVSNQQVTPCSANCPDQNAVFSGGNWKRAQLEKSVIILPPIE